MPLPWRKNIWWFRIEASFWLFMVWFFATTGSIFVQNLIFPGFAYHCAPILHRCFWEHSAPPIYFVIAATVAAIVLAMHARILRYFPATLLLLIVMVATLAWSIAIEY